MRVFKFFASLNFIFLYVVLALVGIGVYSNIQMYDLYNTTNSRAGARTRLYKLEQVMSDLKSIEAKELTYLLTRDKTYSRQFTEAVGKFENQLQDLDRLSRDSDWREHLQALANTSRQAVIEIQRNVEVPPPAADMASFAKALARGKSSLEQSRQLVDSMKAIESANLESHDSQAQSLLRSNSFILFGGGASALILILLTSLQINRNQRQKSRSEMELVRTNHQLEKQKQNLSEVIEAQQAIVMTSLDNEKAMDLIAFYSARLTHADGGLIELVDGDELVYKAATGAMEVFKGMRLKRDGSMSGLCIKEGRALIAADTELDPRVDREACRKVSIRSMIVIPLRYGEKTVGVLKCYSRNTNQFQEDQIHALSLVSGLLSFVYIQAKQFEEKTKLVSTLQVTENKLLRAKETAESETLAKSRFLANISHEIRTPLNGILGAAELLSASIKEEEQKEYLQIIEMAGESLLTLINDILDFSKVESGRLTLNKESFNLLGLLEDLQKMMSHSQPDRLVDLKFEVDPRLQTVVCGDPGRLMQVLIHLVGNAIKFTPNGSVTVAVKSQTENKGIRLQFEIRDQGIGIAKDMLEKLFQAFNQSDKARKFGGTGLGLSISKHLVQLMGGTIGVRSEEGRGSVFWFTALVENAQDAATPEKTKNPFLDSCVQKEAKILLVEDNLPNRKISVRALLKLGFRAYAVADGTSALKELENHDYDLILMDVQMPGMDGFATTRLIRQHPDPRIVRIPIVAMTANAVAGERERCLDAGMDDYLPKPVKASDLRTTVMKWLPPQRDLQEEDLAAVDFEQLRRVLGLDTQESLSQATDIIEAYLSSMPSFIQKIEDGFQNQDWISLRDCAHGVKSSSGNIGAVGLGRLCQQIETLASRHPKSITTDQIRQIKNTYHGVEKNLRAFLRNPDFNPSHLISASEISRLKQLAH